MMLAMTFESQLLRLHHEQVDDLGGRIKARLSCLESSATYADEELCLSHQELSQASLALAQKLSEAVPLHGRVGIAMENSVAMAVAILATLVSQRVPVLVPTKSLKDCGQQLYRQKRLYGLLVPCYTKSHLKPSSGCPIFFLAPDGTVREQTAVESVPTWPLPRSGTALILYTSGSTGEAKGVELSHEGLCYAIDTLCGYFGLSPATRAVINLPLSHSMALNTQFLPTFMAGGHCHFSANDLVGGASYREILKAKATFVALVSDMLPLLAQEKERRHLKTADEVRDVQLAGSLIKTEHLKLAEQLFPQATIYKGYGLSEAIRVTMIKSSEAGFESPSVGTALPGQTITIRGPKGECLAPGVEGEICVAGPNVMLGYDGRVDQHLSHEGYLCTGDYGYLSITGQLIVKGRKDQVFKSQGRKIAAQEIEAVALKVNGVRDACCLAIACEKAGLRPLLFINVGPNAVDAALINSLEGQLTEHLSRYKLPRDVVVLKTWPLGDSRKLSRPMLLSFWAERGRAEVLGTSTIGIKLWSFEDVEMPDEEALCAGR